MCGLAARAARQGLLGQDRGDVKLGHAMYATASASNDEKMTALCSLTDESASRELLGFLHFVREFPKTVLPLDELAECWLDGGVSVGSRSEHMEIGEEKYLLHVAEQEKEPEAATAMTPAQLFAREPQFAAALLNAALRVWKQQQQQRTLER